MTSRQPKTMLPIGKLPIEHLRSLLAELPQNDPRLLIGPQVGEDAAVIDAGDRCLVVATDPITFATDQIGQYAVHINANDVAVLGARPFMVLRGPAASRARCNARAGRVHHGRRAHGVPGVGRDGLRRPYGNHAGPRASDSRGSDAR